MKNKDSDSGINEQIVHNDCGLPIEFCECKNAPFFYDWKDHLIKPRFAEKPTAIRCPDCGTMFNFGKSRCPNCDKFYTPKGYDLK